MLGLLNFFFRKYYLPFLCCLFAGVCWGQVAFDGQPQSLKHLNSVYDENFLVLGQDGAIYFTRLKHPANPKGVNNPGHIWVVKNDTVIESLAGQKASAMGAFLGTAVGNVFYGEVEEEFGAPVTSLYALGSGGKRKLSIPYFVNESPAVSGYISADGNYLLLSLEGRTTYGVEDIYVCRRGANGVWGAPTNLGSTINTNFQEFTPFLSQNNQTIFWASNGRDGAGSFDIYQSTRLDETWQQWSQPVNVSAVNTTGSETSFQMVGDYAYFVSTQDSDGYGDIKRIKLAEPIPEYDEDYTVPFQVELATIPRSFVLKEAITGQDITGDVIVKGQRVDTTFKDVQVARLELLALEDLSLEVAATGYVSQGLVVTATELASSGTVEITMQPLSIGTTVKLEHVLFVRGTTEFVEGSEVELERVVAMMRANPQLKILVKGHTDNQGNAEKNLLLSRERASKVREYIVAGGIEDTRVDSRGFGGTQPVASNANEFTRKLNRRVEFTVIEQ